MQWVIHSSKYVNELNRYGAFWHLIQEPWDWEAECGHLLWWGILIRSVYRDNVSGFDVEAGKVIVVAVILQCSHLHRSWCIYKTGSQYVQWAKEWKDNNDVSWQGHTRQSEEGRYCRVDLCTHVRTRTCVWPCMHIYSPLSSCLISRLACVVVNWLTMSRAVWLRVFLTPALMPLWMEVEGKVVKAVMCNLR